MSDNNDELVSILKDIRRWLKLIALEEARVKVQEGISESNEEKEEENKIIFHLTDGENSSSLISKFVDVSQQTVSKRQQSWAKAGLMEKPAENQPYRKLITLEEAGIDVPDIPEEPEDE